MSSSPKPVAWQLNRGSSTRMLTRRESNNVLQITCKRQEAYLEDEHLASLPRNPRGGVERWRFPSRIPDDFQVRDGDLFARDPLEGPGDRPTVDLRDSQRKPSTIPAGFYERMNQIEQFLLERRFWKTHYPEESPGRRTADRLQSAVAACHPSPTTSIREFWSLATGGALTPRRVPTI
ncbi:hypothetical protein ACPL4A_29820 [Pseudomonas aeruginosa]|uniref:hypothetical protein n=1 Tax=Pseudomonas aeruginosa TaxID=287 RepID=UPI003C710436